MHKKEKVRISQNLTLDNVQLRISNRGMFASFVEDLISLIPKSTMNVSVLLHSYNQNFWIKDLMRFGYSSYFSSSILLHQNRIKAWFIQIWNGFVIFCVKTHPVLNSIKPMIVYFTHKKYHWHVFITAVTIFWFIKSEESYLGYWKGILNFIYNCIKTSLNFF